MTEVPRPRFTAVLSLIQTYRLPEATLRDRGGEFPLRAYREVLKLALQGRWNELNLWDLIEFLRGAIRENVQREPELVEFIRYAQNDTELGRELNYVFARALESETLEQQEASRLWEFEDASRFLRLFDVNEARSQNDRALYHLVAEGVPEGYAERLLRASIAAEMTPREFGLATGAIFSGAMLGQAARSARSVIQTTRGIMKKPGQIRTVMRTVDDAPDEARVEIAQELILKLSPKDAAQAGLRPVVDWFRENCSRGAEGSLYHRLSAEAQKRLTKWLGEVGYGDFRELIKRVLAKSDTLKLQDWELNQLRRRSDFWGMYSESLRSLRALVPKKSQKILGGDLVGLLNSANVGTMRGVHHEPVECAILEFDELVVTEFFRGEGGEGRVFLRENPACQQLLNEKAEPRMEDIRALKADHVFDHRFLWQHEVVSYLESKGLSGNVGVRSVPGVSPQKGAYKRGVGMVVKPAKEELARRKLALHRFRTEIPQLEAKARNVSTWR